MKSDTANKQIMVIHWKPLTYSKQQKILKTVQYFLLKHPEFSSLPCRIDAVAISGGKYQDTEENIEWIRNAIELC